MAFALGEQFPEQGYVMCLPDNGLAIWKRQIVLVGLLLEVLLRELLAVLLNKCRSNYTRHRTYAIGFL